MRGIAPSPSSPPGRTGSRTCIYSSICSQGWHLICDSRLEEEAYGVTSNQCAPRPDSGPGPDEFWYYGKFAQFFVEVMSRYKPGGGLALEDPDWPDNDPFGITHWEFGNEFENPIWFGTIRLDQYGQEKVYGAYREYKEIFGIAHDMLIFYGVPEHKIHGPGPVMTRETSKGCNYNRDDNEIDIFDLAEWCPLGEAIHTFRTRVRP